MSIPTNLVDFEALCRVHGATAIDKFQATINAGAAFRVNNISAASGDCGSDGCRCSPGLWITAFDGDRGVSAHWGDPYDDDGMLTNNTDHRSYGRGQDVEIDHNHIKQWKSCLADLKPILPDL